MRGIRTVIALAASVLALWPSVALGQDVRPRLSVAAGGGIADPLHADFDFTAADWHVSVRASMSSRLAIEAFYQKWEHTDREVLLNQAILGLAGPLGRVERVELATTKDMRTMGMNVVATFGSSRATFSSGGGIGLIAYRRRSTTTSSGCDAAVAHLCGSTENRFSNGDFAAQGVVAMDVAVTRRVQLFGRYLLVVAVTDPGFGYGSLNGGVRIVLF